MPIVRVSAALKSRADNRAEHAVGGRSIGEALHELERSCPALSGWILDERGLIRPHISVFVNGSRGALDTAVGPADRVEILRALSGG